jgi:prepilin-type N-terminal cleavage/methylation domain-containing protein
MKRIHEAGFTVVELLIVIMIIASVSAFALPQLSGLLQGYRLNGGARVVWGDLHRARLMAIKEGRTIRIDVKSATTYEFVRADTAEVAFRRNLSPDYPGITVALTNDTASFGSTGTMGGGSKTVTIQSPTATKSFTILTTGRIGNMS